MPPLSRRLSAAIRTAKAAVKSYFCRCIDLRTLTDFTTPIYFFVHSHLKKVYATLVLACVCTILGVLLDFDGEVGGRFTFLVFSGSMFFLLKTPSRRVAKKIGYLITATFFMGTCIVPCFRPFVNIDHRMLMSIIGEQAACYAVYWLGATAARSGRRTVEWSLFCHKAAVCSLCYYLFLLLFFVYAFFRHNPYIAFLVMVYMVCYRVALFGYGQEMTRRGDENMDCVTSSLRFYTDFPAILAHTFALLVKGFYVGLRRRNRIRIMRNRLARIYKGMQHDVN